VEESVEEGKEAVVGCGTRKWFGVELEVEVEAEVEAEVEVEVSLSGRRRVWGGTG
jgi:hypothetical protein